MGGEGQGVRIPVDSARAADIDHHARLLVFNAEVWRSGTDESEGGGVVHG